MGLLTNLAQSYNLNDSALSNGDPAAIGAAFAAVFLGFLFFGLIIGAIAYVITGIFLMKLFKKAGIESPWAAWVPIYNMWKLLEIGGQPGYWAVLALIPLVNIASVVFMYIAAYNIGLKLGKEGAFILLAIFLFPVWLIWLATDDSKWDDSKGAPSLTPINVAPTTPATPAA